MKALFLHVFSLVVLVSVSLSANDRPYSIEVVVGNEKDDDVDVYGAFSTSENEYGGIELVFYEDIYSYSIRAIESVRDLMASPASSTVKATDKNVVQIVRIFLKPTPIGRDQVRLTGNMTIMVNTTEQGDPLFRLLEKPLDVTMTNDQEEPLTVDPGALGRKVDLTLVLRVAPALDQLAESRETRFGAFYSLFNEDDNSFEIENEPCRITFAPGDDESGFCRHSRLYYLDNGDSLLYIVEYNIDAVKQLQDGAVNFTVSVRRFFYENPFSFFSRAGDDTHRTGQNNWGDDRTVDCQVSINGKNRRVGAVIDGGRVTEFRWDNIRLLPRDIVRNWDDIVGLLRKIETTGDYDYQPPVLTDSGGPDRTGEFSGLLASPENYTGDVVTTTTYSKSVTLTRWEKAEIEIPFTRSHRLPFNGHEIIRLEKLDSQASVWE